MSGSEKREGHQGVKRSIAIRILGPEPKEWTFDASKECIRFGGTGTEVTIPQLGQVIGQLIIYQGAWWVQSPEGVTLRVSESGIPSGFKEYPSQAQLDDTKPHLIELNSVRFRIEWRSEESIQEVDNGLVQSSQSSSPSVRDATPQSPMSPPVLIVQVRDTNGQLTQTHSLSESKWLIGRGDEVAVSLDDRFASRQHIEVSWIGDHYSVRNLSSLGTLLDDGTSLTELNLTEPVCLHIGVHAVMIYLEQDQAIIKQREVEKQQQLREAQAQVDLRSKPAVASKMNLNPDQVEHRPQVSGSAKSAVQRDDAQPSSTLRGSWTAMARVKRLGEAMKASRRNQDHSWREPFDVFAWTNTKFAVCVALLSMGLWVAYWYQSNRLLVGTHLSSAHSGEAYLAMAMERGLSAESCQNCHTTTREVSADACRQCHDQTDVQSPFHDLHHGKHKGDDIQAELSDCSNCHAEHVGDELTQALIPTVEGRGNKCASCHPKAGQIAQSGKSAFTLERHSRLAMTSDLPAGVPRQPAPVQIGVSVSRHKHLTHITHDGLKGACIGCHANQDRTGPTDPKAGCYRCHSGLTSSLAEVPSSSLSSSLDLNQACLTCHTFSDRLKTIFTSGIPDDFDRLLAIMEEASWQPGSYQGPTVQELAEASRPPIGNPQKSLDGIFAAASTFCFVFLIALRHRLRSRRDHIQLTTAKEGAGKEKKKIEIYDDACVGCAACVQACPYDVLSLTRNEDQKLVAKVLNFDSCNECGTCEEVCIPKALTRRLEGEPEPTSMMPALDSQYMSIDYNGLYLIGEASGVSLVRNANNLGAKVVLHIDHRNDRGEPNTAVLDVAIIGGGPAGVSAGITCQQRGLSYSVFERSSHPLDVLVTGYQKGKPVQNQPQSVKNIGALPMDGWDVLPKEVFLEQCEEVMRRSGVHITLNEKVRQIDHLDPLEDGELRQGGARFAVHTSGGVIKARNVIIAVGARGAPRTLDCLGGNDPRIRYQLDDPDAEVGKQVMIIGGGNVALEAAIGIAKANLSRGIKKPCVTLAYRGDQFKRASKENIMAFKELVVKKGITVLYHRTPEEITATQVKLSSTKKQPENSVSINADVILCMIGSIPPQKWLTAIGVSYHERRQGWLPSQSDDLTFLDF